MNVKIMEQSIDHSYSKLEVNNKLIEAIKKDCMDNVELILETATIYDLKIVDFYGKTLLMWAAIKGNISLVELLIKKGAEVNIRDKHNNTALMWAVRNMHNDVSRILLKNNADISIKCRRNETALTIAKKSGNIDLVELLSSYTRQ